jgi:hypothetical protein
MLEKMVHIQLLICYAAGTQLAVKILTFYN